jgi:hypothetical protein
VAAEFVALADLFRPPAPIAAHAPAQSSAAVAASAASAAKLGSTADSFDETSSSFGSAAVARARPAAGDRDDVVSTALRDARLFRARLADVLDDAASRLLRELACDVLARELRIAPCDLAAIVQRVIERAPVVRVRVAACDVGLVAAVLRARGCDVVGDSALAAGDALLEIAGGALDARLGVRLAMVLEAFA